MTTVDIGYTKIAHITMNVLQFDNQHTATYRMYTVGLDTVVGLDIVVSLYIVVGLNMHKRTSHYQIPH